MDGWIDRKKVFCRYHRHDRRNSASRLAYAFVALEEDRTRAADPSLETALCDNNQPARRLLLNRTVTPVFKARSDMCARQERWKGTFFTNQTKRHTVTRAVHFHHLAKWSSIDVDVWSRLPVTGGVSTPPGMRDRLQ